jgi:endonuclease/exonuclease/phosphatase family metal-dependent hydrolase
LEQTVETNGRVTMCKRQVSVLRRPKTIALFEWFGYSAVRGTKTVLAVLAMLGFGSGVGSAPVRADDNDGNLGRHEVRALTQNMYVGAALAPVLGAKTVEEFKVAITAFYQNVLATKPAERAAAMAAEIAKQRPDFVALHEAWILSVGGIVQMDLLKSVRDDLQALGQPYDLVPGGIVTLEDIALPPSLGNIHLTDQDAILMRTDVDIQPIGVQSQHFPTPIILPTPLPPPFNRITLHAGYVSVDAIVRSLPLRFVSVHLIPNPGTILAHTNELLQLAAKTTTLPLVFGGDFNTTADDPSNPSYVIYQTLINAGLTDAWNPQRPGPTAAQDPSLLNAQSLLDHRIDLILFRGAFAAQPINLIGNKPSDRTPSGLWPSDHAGIVATLAGPESQQFIGNQNGQSQNGQ